PRGPHHPLVRPPLRGDPPRRPPHPGAAGPGPWRHPRPGRPRRGGHRPRDGPPRHRRAHLLVAPPRPTLTQLTPPLSTARSPTSGNGHSSLTSPRRHPAPRREEQQVRSITRRGLASALSLTLLATLTVAAATPAAAAVKNQQAD